MKAIVLGAGYRGRAYAEFAKSHPDRLEIAGVADLAPSPGIPATRRWRDWRDCIADRPEADFVIITLPDALHYEAAMAALDCGYHILLEKPIATSEAQCREVIARAHEKRRLAMVAHVLRHTPYFAHVKAIVDSGEIGEIVSIAHQESAGFCKIAHSFCRGNWANSSNSSPIILQKCSHDLDLFAWWVNRPCRRVSSFGSIKFFRRENRPAGAAERCVDCPAAIESNCVWSARRMYVECDELKYLFADSSKAAMERLVRESEYGRCVFCCDNDVPDHQCVNLEFEGGATASLTMTGFTARSVRTTRISCTLGEIVGDGENLSICRFDGGNVRAGVPTSLRVANHSRHGGGDFNLVSAMLGIIERGDEGEMRRVTAESLESHLIAFAAERSRIEGRVVELGARS